MKIPICVCLCPSGWYRAVGNVRVVGVGWKSHLFLSFVFSSSLLPGKKLILLECQFYIWTTEFSYISDRFSPVDSPRSSRYIDNNFASFFLMFIIKLPGPD